MRKLKLSTKSVLALLSVMVLIISIGLLTIPAKAASAEACANFCMREYYVPGNPYSLVLVAVCYDGCVNGPIE
jgi:hypothetical protein